MQKNDLYSWESVVNDWTCQNWFAKFHDGDLAELTQLDKPVKVDGNQIKILCENNQHYIMWETANVM